MKDAESKAAGSFALLTFGCKVNRYESHALREAWLARGAREEGENKAAVVCIATCAVTAKGVADARAAIRRVHRENPGASIIVTGCAAQAFAGEFRKIEGVSLVVPQRERADLLRMCPPPFAAGSVLPADTALDAPGYEAPNAFPPFSVAGYDRSRAVLKVQDGCSHRCTYCIVPLARGRSVSRAPEETLAEARRLLGSGFREIVLNGINLAQYGRDFSGAIAGAGEESPAPHGKRPAPPGLAPANGSPPPAIAGSRGFKPLAGEGPALAGQYDFWDLVAYLDEELAPEWAGRARFRLSSLEPGQLGAKALDVLGKSSMVAPHLHLSLQSGSPEILRRMGRGHYDVNALPDFCRELATVFPVFGLGADILCAFPGETDAQAGETERFVVSLPFTYAHVFPYSRRPGTPAAAWPDQVPSVVKKERAARLRKVFVAKKTAFLEQCASLPEVTVALEEGAREGAGREQAAPGGVNEFYAECVFVAGKRPGGASRKSLVKGRPLFARDGKLFVGAFE